MIWIIGGTSEARELVSNIEDLEDFIVTVATQEGKEFLGTDNVMVGRLRPDEMEALIEKKSIRAIVDLTHPYAHIVSENAIDIAAKKNIDYIRYVRPAMEGIEDVIYLKSYDEAYEYLSQIEGTVFFTTGSKNIGDFEKVRASNRFIYRILPAISSLEIAEDHGVSIRDLVAELGPFSKDYNKAMFKEYAANYIVSKDSGKKGGTFEKIQAARELGIRTILIGRYDEKGYSSLEEIERIIRSYY